MQFDLGFEFWKPKPTVEQLTKLHKYFKGHELLCIEFNKRGCPGIPNTLFARTKEDLKKYRDAEDARETWICAQRDKLRISLDLTWDEIRMVDPGPYLMRNEKATIDDYFAELARKQKERDAERGEESKSLKSESTSESSQVSDG